MDSTGQQLADYYQRLLEYYTKGGFVDELGNVIRSKYNYNITIWEVLNEVEAEHKMDPTLYTLIYDKVVNAMLKVNPNMKFVGMALAFHNEWDWVLFLLTTFFETILTPFLFFPQFKITVQPLPQPLKSPTTKYSNRLHFLPFLCNLLQQNRRFRIRNILCPSRHFLQGGL